MIKAFIVKESIELFNWISGISYWICLFVCMFSVIFYIAGCKKAGKYITLSFVAYILIESVKLCL